MSNTVTPTPDPTPRPQTVGQRIQEMAKELDADAHKLVDEFEHWLHKETGGVYKPKVPDPAATAASPTPENDSGSVMQSTVPDAQKAADPSQSPQVSTK